MKKALLILTLLVFNCSYSQNQTGKLVSGSKVIRIDSQEIAKPEASNQSLSNKTNNETEATPTGISPEIGSTDGSLTVSLSGAAQYSIPFIVPPGIKDVEPQISLEYSSQRGNGIAGFGWSLGGVSIITRIPSTLFHDGFVDPVDFDDLDRFSFNGNRLIKKNSADVYGANGTVYETENYSNIKITSFGGNNNNPDYFKVEHPNGDVEIISAMGVLTDLHENWYLTKVTDPQNISIIYSYEGEANNDYRLKKINYGGLEGAIYRNEIVFDYTDNVLIENNYVGGKFKEQKKLLKTIKMASNGIGFRTYTLQYESNFFNRLYDITEANGDNTKKYNPTRFVYDINEISQSTNPYNLLVNSITSQIAVGEVNFLNSNNITGDFNGDGKIDFALHPTTGPNAKKVFWIFDDLHGEAGTWTKTAPIGDFEQIFASNWLSWDNTMMTREGITAIQKDPAISGKVFFKTYSDEPYGIFEQYTKEVNFPQPLNQNGCLIDNSSPPGATFSFPKTFLSGDFNGDGLTDVVALDKNSICSVEYIDPVSGLPEGTTDTPVSSRQTYFIDLNRNKPTNFMNEAGDLVTYIGLNDKLLVADYDGDGKTDIFHFAPSNIRIYSLNNTNQLVLIASLGDTTINLINPILMGDFNGDGKADFCIPRGFGTIFDFFYATGIAFDKKTTNMSFAQLAYRQSDGIKTYTLSTADMNNDGKTDFIETISERYAFNWFGNKVVGDTHGNMIVNTYYNDQRYFSKKGTGTVGFNNSMTINPSTNPGLPGIKRYPVPIFLSPTRSNLNSTVALITNNSVYSFDVAANEKNNNLLKLIINGNGFRQNIEYKPMINVACVPYCDGLNFYTQDYGLTEKYPFTNITRVPNFLLVSKIKQNNLTQDFGYFGAVSNLEGLGFQGFRAVARTNFYNANIPIITNYSQFNVALRGALIAEYTVNGTLPLTSPPTEYLSKRLFTYNTYDNINFEPTVSANKIFRLKNTIVEAFDELEGTNQKIIKNYDQYFNVDKLTTQISQGTIIQKTIVEDIVYDNAPNSLTDYHIGRVMNKKQQVTTPIDSMQSEEAYTYGTALQKNLVKTLTKFANNNYAEFVKETNDFDVYGNLKSKLVAGSDGTSRLSLFEYDDTAGTKNGGRFLTKTTSADGLVVDYKYDANTGMLQKQTSPYHTTANPIFSEFTYDSFFRKLTEKTFLGTTLTNSTTNSYERAYSPYYIFIKQSSTDGSESKTFFDEQNRPYIAGSKNINGLWSYVQVQYDDLGRKAKVSEPYFSAAALPLASASVLWTKTEFDPYGRVQKITEPTNKQTTMSYNGLTTTIADNVKTKTTVKNAVGNIVAVTDPGGTITFEYFANDAMQKSTLGDNVVETGRDNWGRKISLNDPSAGLYKYKYNLLGETTAIETPKGTTQYKIAPNTGKLLQKTIRGEFTNSITDYNYYPDSKKLANIVHVDNLTGNTTNYGYSLDAFKRLVATTEDGVLASFSHSITYDSFSRPQFETLAAMEKTTGRRATKSYTNTYKNGYDFQILDNASTSGAVLWQTNTVNERGQVTDASFGGPGASQAMGSQKTLYDIFGFPLQTHFKSVNNQYGFSLFNSFNPITGNLTDRNSDLFNTKEAFEYDVQGLDRLTKITDIIAGTEKFQDYDPNGKIVKNDLGVYNYTLANATPPMPFTNTSVTINDNSDDKKYYEFYTNQHIDYNVLKKPVQIIEKGMENIFFEYNAFDQRATMFYGDEEQDKTIKKFTKSYSADGTMEITLKNPTGDKAIDFIFYIGGSAYSAPLIYKADAVGTEQFLYLHRDYQGSIVALTDQSGQLIEKRFFDAWGQLTQYSDWQGNKTPIDGHMVIDRGYTGHEHLLPTFDQFGFGYGIINMNGRLYDPKLHRFLMPDNNIQDPYNSQNYNRYGYVLNNPLKNTDPTGETCNCPENNGPSDGQQTFIGNAALYIKNNWDNWGIKDWSNRNLNIKNISNSVSDGLKSAGDFITRNLESLANDIANFLGLGGSSKPKPQPVTYQFQMNGPMPNTFGQGLDGYYGGNGLNYAAHQGDQLDPKPKKDYKKFFRRMLSQNNPNLPTVDDKGSGIDHYYAGNFRPAQLGPKSIKALLQSEEYLRVQNRLVNGQAQSLTNTFDVDLTFQGAFIVGRTNVDYATTCSSGNCTTIFRAFVRDSFSDPLGLGFEYSMGGPGGSGVAQPYNFIPVIFSIRYSNPGYPINR
jgi:RHS repeat-associated protein